MATPPEISAFRLMIDEPTFDMYSDLLLSDRIDSSTSKSALASIIWLEKAAKYARLVDIQEGTSRRALSQLQEHALLMSKSYAAQAGSDGTGSTSRQTVTRPIERV